MGRYIRKLEELVLTTLMFPMVVAVIIIGALILFAMKLKVMET